jgi:hypothetical protein
VPRPKRLACGVAKNTDSLACGGFTGKIALAPVNAKPPAPPEDPQRPGEDEG